MSLELKNVSYSFNKQNALISNLSLKVESGEFVSLIGKSGTGKTTIFKLITGLLTPDEGQVLLYGNPIRVGDVGYMPQRDLLLPWRTIMDNIMIAAEINKEITITKSEARKWLERVGLLEYENALPKELSGGMRQRAAFLRALLTGKDVLLLDEPFGALDSLTKVEMQKWLTAIWQELNKTVLFITHDLEEACYLSDRVLILQQDSIVEEVQISLPRPREAKLFHSLELLSLRKTLEGKIAYEMD